MRTLFLAVLLTLAFAGSARAQEQVRTGPLRAVPAAAPRAGRPVPARVVRQAKSTSRSVVQRAKPSLVTGTPANRSRGPRVKRPAPRG
jgi:hypothetical protein